MLDFFFKMTSIFFQKRMVKHECFLKLEKVKTKAHHAVKDQFIKKKKV